MIDDTSAGRTHSYAAHVYSAADFEVISGANLGDPLMLVQDLCLGDVYMLHPDAEALALAIRNGDGDARGSGRFLGTKRAGQHLVSDGSEIGQPGDALTLEARLSFMAPDGDNVELVLIGHNAGDTSGGALFVLPLDPVDPKVAYTLLSAAQDPGEVRLSDITPVAFNRGTLITLATGTQTAIEDLRPGDRVLTRDHGPQDVRWIGQRTVRAIGTYAPVVITKGTLANESDLIVSQLQRLFIYQQGGNRLAHTAEVLVKARDLVDGDNVFIRKGGFVEYFYLVFDRHEIIYAEYIPTESLLINDRALDRLPEDLAHDVAQRLPDAKQEQHFGTEADKSLLAGRGPADLRRPPRKS